eukprot:5403885-Prymnesium_polylepis.1
MEGLRAGATVRRWEEGGRRAGASSTCACTLGGCARALPAGTGRSLPPKPRRVQPAWPRTKTRPLHKTVCRVNDFRPSIAKRWCETAVAPTRGCRIWGFFGRPNSTGEHQDIGPCLLAQGHDLAWAMLEGVRCPVSGKLEKSKDIENRHGRLAPG